jgi:hypothetical protein
MQHAMTWNVNLIISNEMGDEESSVVCFLFKINPPSGIDDSVCDYDKT